MDLTRLEPIMLRRMAQPEGPFGASLGQVHCIGVELRLRHHPTGQAEELALVPMDLWLPSFSYAGTEWSMPSTLHTNAGDIGFEIFVPPGFAR